MNTIETTTLKADRLGVDELNHIRADGGQEHRWHGDLRLLAVHKQLGSGSHFL